MAGQRIKMRSSSGISLKTAPVEVKSATEEPQAALTDEMLQAAWQEYNQSLKEHHEQLRSLLADKKVALASENSFNLLANNFYFETEMKPFMMDMIIFMRSHTGIPNLNCDIVVEKADEKDAVPYTADEKFAAMASINPAIVELRKMFPDIHNSN